MAFTRRTKLREIEQEVRDLWTEAKVYEAEVDPSKESFLVTFPYPYMNGRIHLGHAFTITKADFTARYQRLRGKNVLFPFGFHCTGMPIQGAATKLKLEIENYGCPPVLPTEEDDVELSGKGGEGFKSAKTKLTQKTGGVKLQWDILKNMGIDESEIPKFVDPVHWLNYFPAFGERDLKIFGLHTDWRRSFITTSENKFYDQFIRWQFTRLKGSGKVQFGRRATIYSALDQQACADHDRATGEGVGPQEYTLIKLRVLELAEETLKKNPALADAISAGNLYMVAATLRPETMYGQTNCFVLPSGEYGAYEFDIQESPDMDRMKQVLICSERAAKNMSYQDPFAAPAAQGALNCVGKLTGVELVGVPVKAPKTSYEKVYTLPLLTISMDKGTGVVTSVPSDAPDDYAALRDWQTDEKLRAKHGVTEEMVAPFQVIPIIDIPGLGDKAAVTMCEKLKIKSQHDEKKLKQAKEETYKRGFYEGIMIVGDEDGVKGMKVCDAKDIVKAAMCKNREAIIYYEPEESVVSRSGDNCIVAYLDQWYLTYGEKNWCDTVKEHVNDTNRFETFTTATRKAFQDTLDWLKEWACSRNFGLGTLVPWDEQFVIESLSDSTIYMAYYTIAHLLQGRANDEDYNGSNGQGSPLGIKPEQLTVEVFDYIFLGKPYPADCGIEEDKLARLRASFEYWYPMDLRVSGRDLIRNHLTMSLYNHAAIWSDRPDLWPKAFFCNGFIEIDGEKMSKSLGNFVLIEEACVGHRTFTLKGKEHVVGWSADATRLALAVAGDGLEGANFASETADKTILRLTTELEWGERMFSEDEQAKMRNVPADEYNFYEKAFDAQMELAVENTKAAYDAMRYRDVAKHGFYDFQAYRDAYRDACEKDGIPFHSGLIKKYFEILAIINCPIIPHYMENIWRNLLKKDGFVVQASWPEFPSKPNVAFVRSVEFLNTTIRMVRQKVTKLLAKGKYKEIKSVALHISTQFPAHHQAVINLLTEKLDKATGTFPDDMMKQIKDLSKTNDVLKKNLKDVMKIAANAIAQYNDGDHTGLELSVPYDQKQILEEQRSYVTSAMMLESFSVEEHEQDESATPGLPRIEIIS